MNRARELPPMEQDRTLDEFQAALLELLDQPLAPDEILARLKTDEAFVPSREYVETFEPRMVEVAAELVKKWGRRSATTSDDSTDRS